MNSRAKWIAAALLASVAAGPAAAEHSWGNYHWSRSSNPLALKIERQIGSQWETSFNTAVADWHKSSVLSLTGATSNLGVSPKKCNPIRGSVLACSDSYGFRGWLGIATIWAEGDHIYQATTQVNDSYFNTTTYNKPEWRALVMCQELGHDFGLDHQDENFDNTNLGTCQDYTNNPLGPPSNEHPNTHDYAQLDTIYGHLDGSDGGGGGDGGGKGPPPGKGPKSDAFTFREPGKPAPSASSEGAGLSPAEWGRAIAYDGAGRPDTFLMDLGGNRRKITHVFWVPGLRPQGSR